MEKVWSQPASVLYRGMFKFKEGRGRKQRPDKRFTGIFQ